MKIEEDVGQRVGTEMERRRKQWGRIIATRWKKNAEEYLREVAERRSDNMGDNAESGLHRIADEFTDPEWDDSRNRWTFDVDHPAAYIHEVGAQEHEIRARRAQVLAFEWPNAPEEVKEKFSHTEGDLVFFKSVNHPGVPAIGYIAEGRSRTKREVKRGDTGVSADEFSLSTGGSGSDEFDLSVGGGDE